MGIGLGIFLIVIGAVLKFGITADVAALDLEAIGIIFMMAGSAVIALTIFMMVLRRERSQSDRIRSDGDVV